jgi:endoglucanase
MLNKLSFFLIILTVTANLSAMSQDSTSWQNFKDKFIQKDGRVIDYMNSDITHTEGIGYALYFSQYFNDKKTFDIIYTWYTNNIKKNNFNLPGWKWGKAEDGTWKMLDFNSASDANLWIAYSLLLMNDKIEESRYKTEALSLIKNIKQYQIKKVNSKTYLLPAENGFSDKNSLKLNPSYMLFEIFQYLSKYEDDNTWENLIDSSKYILKKAQFSKLQLHPDWLILNIKNNQFSLDTKKPLFSYDAIRIPLNIIRSSLNEATKEELLQPYINYVKMMKNSSLGSVDLNKGIISMYDMSFGHLAVYLKIAKQYNLDNRNLDAELKKRMKKEHENYYAYSLYLFTTI